MALASSGAGAGGVGEGRAGTRVARGSDMVGTLDVSFREAALGTRRSIRNGAGNTIEVAIPSGVDTGGRLRLGGQGAPAPQKGGEPGDLHLEVRVMPDPHLRRSEEGSGYDVELDLPLSVPEAALGTKIEVPTVENPVTITIPPGHLQRRQAAAARQGHQTDGWRSG